MKNTLITGGARSGKSSFAQQLALKSGKSVLFVATAEAGDEEMRQRIEKHQQERPPTWSTLEAYIHVGSRITQKVGDAQIVIVDCVTLLVSNILQQYSDPAGEQIDASLAEKAIMAEIGELVDAIDRVQASFIIVTNEVGLGLVPPNKMGRLYRDILGKVNQMLAKHSDEVYLMVAGIPVLIKPPEPPDSIYNIM